MGSEPASVMVAGPGLLVAQTSSRARLRSPSRNLKYSGYDELPAPSGLQVCRMTREAASRTGSVVSKSELRMLKIAVLAPIPIASDKTATDVTPGLLRNIRNA